MYGFLYSSSLADVVYVDGIFQMENLNYLELM